MQKVLAVQGGLGERIEICIVGNAHKNVIKFHLIKEYKYKRITNSLVSVSFSIHGTH